MKFVLATWGSRGDIEPSAAVGRELVRRGHDVCMAVPPDLIEFTAAAVPNTVGFGPNSRSILDAHRDYWTCFFSSPWKLRQMGRARSEAFPSANLDFTPPANKPRDERRSRRPHDR